MARLVFIWLVTISFHLSAQERFKAEIDKVYDFHPYKLSRKQQNQKIPRLDAFFKKIKADTGKYLPLLRTELQSNDHFPYFYYDCGHLLMMLSESVSDKKISASAFAKCDTRDLDAKMYVSVISSLAQDGIDITKAATNILNDTAFSFYMPEHAFRFGQQYCLAYCLLPLSSSMYVDTLIGIFKRTKHVEAQKSILSTLWFAYDCTGEKFLRSLDETSASDEVKGYAKALLIESKIPQEAIDEYKVDDVRGLKELKLSALNRYSDEAIYDLYFATISLRQKTDCN